MSGLVYPCSFGTCTNAAAYVHHGHERHYCARHVPCGQRGCESLARYAFTWPGKPEGAICEPHRRRAQEIADRMGLLLEFKLLVPPPICPACAAPASAVDDDGGFWCESCARAVES